MKWWMLKNKGSAGVIDHLPIFLLIIMSAYILIQNGFNSKNMEMLNRLNGISQKYALIMETTNGLAVEDVLNLYEELEGIGIGINDVSLFGTTFANESVEYGDTIYLKMQVKIPYYGISINDKMQSVFHQTKKEVNIVKCALALG